MENYLGFILVLIFGLEVMFLSLMSKKLHFLVWRLFYLISHSTKTASYLLAILFIPGTLIHELAHAISAGVMLISVGALELMPEIRENSLKLGSVQIGLTDPFRRAIIGVAPVLVGIGMLLGIAYYLTSDISKSATIPYSIWLIIFYSVFVITNTMFSSSKDLEGAFEVLIFVICIFLALYLLKFIQVFDYLGQLINTTGLEYIKLLVKLLSLPIIVDLTALGILKVILPKHYQ